MPKATRFLLTGAVVLAAGAALADPPAQPANPGSPAPASTTVSPAVSNAAQSDKVICKYEVPTGSRLGGHKTCMKKSDWDLQTRQNADMMAHRTGNSWSPAH
jgi:hypothetical protein